ncbi:MAG: hypothetical protein ACYDB5_06335 [bacterium]
MLRSRNARRFCSRSYKPRAKRSSRTINLYRQFWKKTLSFML